MKFETLIFLMSFLLNGCMTDWIYENRLRDLTESLESIVDSSEQNSLLDGNNVQARYDSIEIDKRIEVLKNEYQLCTISNYISGIVFHFKCSDSLYKEPNYGDTEYFLIKVLSRSNKDNLLSNEGFIDCAKEPERINDDWYLIRKHITCD